MAKDGFDVVTDVRALVNVPEILSLLEGGLVEPSIKSTDASVKGIVVNTTGITNTQDQIGYGSVNCYAPPIETTVKGKVQQLPDQAALSTMVKAVKPLIDGIYAENFRIWIEEMGHVYQNTDGSYFASVRYRYQSIQENYKNI